MEHKQQTTSLTIKEDKLCMEEIKKLSSGKVACVGCWRGGKPCMCRLCSLVL